MGNINNKVKELHPHVLSIRFMDGLTVIDCAFKDGWAIPKSDAVGHETSPDKPNYYMLYPLSENVGIDEMLDYVTYVIKVNIERELKIKLLQIKVNELKQLFTKTSLAKCKTIQFEFKTNLDITTEDNINLDEMPIYNENTRQAELSEYPNDAVNEAVNDGELDYVKPISRQDVINDKDVNNVNPATASFNNETFDLPPKKNNKVVEVQEFAIPEVICKCDPLDPNQVCPACI
jgi:hypothetical protein